MFVKENPDKKKKKIIRTLKIKFYKYMTLILKDVYIDKLVEVANKYDNTYHRTINMKPVDVNQSSYIEFKKPLKKFNTVKGKKFCNNYFRDDYFTSKVQVKKYMF